MMSRENELCLLREIRRNVERRGVLIARAADGKLGGRATVKIEYFSKILPNLLINPASRAGRREGAPLYNFSTIRKSRR